VSAAAGFYHEGTPSSALGHEQCRPVISS
jgi:hypothetical protein